MAQVAGSELHKGLTQRHLTMIAIGGVIGAGLFVGSGVVINTVGPGAFLTYAVTGMLIVMVMRMLGEMATANPATGSFAAYARQALGDWAGFSVAWLYWYFWVIVVGFEAVAGAGILQKWLPDVPLVVDVAGPAAPDDGDQPLFGQVLRRVRVLVRQYQGRRDHRVPVAGHALRARPVARARAWTSPTCTRTAGSSPTAWRRSSPASSWSSSRWSAPRSRPSPRRSPPSPSAPSPARSTPWCVRICIFFVGSIFLLAVHPAVELQGAGRQRLCRRVRADGHRLGRQCDERGRAQRGAVLPELRALHRLAHVVRAGRPARGADPAARGQQRRRPGRGDPVLDGDRLSVRRRRLRLARHRVPVPAQLLGRDHPVRLPDDRRSPSWSCGRRSRRSGSR